MDALPVDVQQELVMSAAGFAGHSVTTHRFRSSRPPEQLAADLRERWSAEGVRYVETIRGEWTVLSSRKNDVIETLQLRSTTTGTEGLHSLWQRDLSRESTGPGGPGGQGGPGRRLEPGAAVSVEARSQDLSARMRRWLPPAAVTIRDIVHRDGPRQAATLVATAAQAPLALRSALEHQLALDGYVRDASFDDRLGVLAAARQGTPHRHERNGEALAFRRGAEEVVATVAAHRGESAIVIHWSVQR